MSHNHTMKDTDTDLTIRVVHAHDAQGVAEAERLAALDSAPVPAPPYVMAALDGRAVAARSLADGAIVADPFARTIEVVSMLELRAAQLGRTSRVGAAIGRRRRIGLRVT